MICTDGISHPDKQTIAKLLKWNIDAAVICLEIKKEINFETTDYVIGEVHKRDGVLAQGFPGSETEIEELLNYVEGTYGRILHNAKDKEVLLWQIEDTHVDHGNRVYELNGFSGSPVWSLEADEKTIVGLFTSGVGRSIYRGKVHALKMEAIRNVLVEQGLMPENEFHRISLIAYMCNLDSENAWKHFSKETPLFGKFDKAENEGVLLTNEGARFLVWQKKYPPHMEREWRRINIQGANAAKALFEQEEWHLSPKSIANKLQYEIHKSIAIDVWGLYILAVEEKLELLEQFDQVYVTHFSVSRMLEEITHFKNENIEVILVYLESAEHVKLQSLKFETQLRIRENVKYYEPCSTVAMAIEAEIPAVIGEPMLIQSLIDGFKNYIVRPDDLEKMMEI